MFCASLRPLSLFLFFFFNDTATTEIYTLSLHDALPIFDEQQVSRPRQRSEERAHPGPPEPSQPVEKEQRLRDRKSTRLNSSHLVISYAVFCLKKKKKNIFLTYRKYYYDHVELVQRLVTR